MFRHSLLPFLLFLLLAAPAGAQTIYGAGSTFAAPLYIKWSQEYEAQTGVTIAYEPIGSGGGIKNIMAHAVDFGISDAPMNAAELAAAPGILHIPTVAHAVVLVYNLPGIGAVLHLTGPVVADIYLGKITHWNDPRLVRLNSGLTLPDLAIFPVHQSNGSGTNYLLTNYLSAFSSVWKDSVGAGKNVHWPVGLGGKQCAGVAQMVKQNAGGFGYMEWSNAATSGLPIATLQNAKGNFVSPAIESTELAAAAAKMSPDLRGSILNSPAPGGYPLVGYIYLLIYSDAKPAVKDFARWVLTQDQRDAEPMGYAPLPPGIRKLALGALKYFPTNISSSPLANFFGKS